MSLPRNFFGNYRASCKQGGNYNINTEGRERSLARASLTSQIQRSHVEGDDFETQLNQIHFEKDVYTRIENGAVLVSLKAPRDEVMAERFRAYNIYLAPWLPNDYGLLVYDPSDTRL